MGDRKLDSASEARNVAREALHNVSPVASQPTTLGKPASLPVSFPLQGVRPQTGLSKTAGTTAVRVSDAALPAPYFAPPSGPAEGKPPQKMTLNEAVQSGSSSSGLRAEGLNRLNLSLVSRSLL